MGGNGSKLWMDTESSEWSETAVKDVEQAGGVWGDVRDNEKQVYEDIW